MIDAHTTTAPHITFLFIIDHSLLFTATRFHLTLKDDLQRLIALLHGPILRTSTFLPPSLADTESTWSHPSRIDLVSFYRLVLVSPGSLSSIKNSTASHFSRFSRLVSVLQVPLITAHDVRPRNSFSPTLSCTTRNQREPTRRI